MNHQTGNTYSYQNLSSPAPSGAGENNPKAVMTKKPGAFKTISEVAKELGVQQHVLRFWETKFSHIRPLKRGGGRRYYRPEDVNLLKKIHELLYVQGYTIKGVQKLLREQGKNTVLQNEQDPSYIRQSSNNNKALDENDKIVLKTMLDELKELRRMVQAP